MKPYQLMSNKMVRFLQEMGIAQNRGIRPWVVMVGVGAVVEDARVYKSGGYILSSHAARPGDDDAAPAQSRWWCISKLPVACRSPVGCRGVSHFYSGLGAPNETHWPISLSPKTASVSEPSMKPSASQPE